MTDDCKRKFRQETKNIYQRLVRKFNTDLIIQLVPNTDVQTHVRLRAINKESERLKRNKEKMNDKADVDFSLKTKPKTYVLNILFCFFFLFINFKSRSLTLN